MDNDCDTRADENVSAPDDENVCLNVGVCDNATPQCATGEWLCDYGVDYDGPSEARCDGLDNDCDGASDEDFDFNTKADHCGGCGRQCGLPNATPTCVNGECTADQCEDGWHDVDGVQQNGCEYGPCIPAPDGEVCDGQDNDCDGLIDEGFAELEDEPDALGEDTNCDGVDGTIARSLFVAPNGNDRNNGLTPDAPLATVGRAMRLSAAIPGRDRVLVQSGLYRSDETITLIGGTSLHAGYGAGFGVRDEQRATVIITATPGLQAIALGQPTRLERFSFEVVDQDSPSAPAIGFVVTESADHLELVDCDVLVGRGGDGQSGMAGLDGDAGTRGVDGAGKNGGLGSPLGGGNGATGRRRASGPAGAAGNANGSQCGGGAGSGSGNGGLGCGDGDPRRGGNGGNGCAGPTGANGTAGNGVGTLANLSWRSVDGQTGTNGGPGGGGGGGGAGGGELRTTRYLHLLWHRPRRRWRRWRRRRWYGWHRWSKWWCFHWPRTEWLTAQAR